MKQLIKRIKKLFVNTGVNVFDGGNGNKIEYNSTSRLKDTTVEIQGNNNLIFFDDYCSISGLHIFIVGDNNQILFGKGVAVNASVAQPTVINAVGGKSVEIGDGALFSNNIEIHTSDYHGIYNAKGDRINSDKNIKIGCYVWIGLRTIILKGTEIANGCVVGAGSVLSGKYVNENVIICGNPGNEIKDRIFWKYTKEGKSEVPDTLQQKWGI